MFTPTGNKRKPTDGGKLSRDPQASTPGAFSQEQSGREVQT